MPDIYFSQVREDSLVERSLKDGFALRKIVAIGSGGCTAFSLLDDSVETVYAVDLNPAQTALIELKKAAIRALNRPEFLSFVGEAPGPDRLSLYRSLRDSLPPAGRSYWDDHPADIEMGINQCGATERFYRFLGGIIRGNVLSEGLWRDLFASKSLAEQQSFCELHLTSERWRTALRILLSKSMHLLFFPSFMFARSGENDFGTFFAQQFERTILSLPVKDNYFLSQLLFSSYLPGRPEGYPRYLTEEGFRLAKENLEKLLVVSGPLQEFLPRAAQVDGFFLSNVFDWCGAKEQEAIGKGIFQARAARAVVLWRNMLSVNEIPEVLRSHLTVDPALSERLLRMERSMMYQKITAGTLQ